MIQKLRNNAKGFTLIELMIVIAIIGILAAIAVPQFMAYRTRSYNAAAKAVAHNLKADQGNLNSELAAYGHTEAGTANLLTATAAAALADTFTTPALAIPATATTAGARLAGAHPISSRNLSIGTALGTNMEALASESANADSHVIVARHYKGDTAYGLDSDVENALYTVTNATWVNTAALVATTNPAATISNDDFSGTSGGGAPTANWMMSE